MKLGRRLNSLLGLGVHKCPAGSFLEQVGDKATFRTVGLKSPCLVDNAGGMYLWCTVTAVAPMSQQIFRVIFRQQDLKRASGRKGQLKSTTLHPGGAPVRF